MLQQHEWFQCFVRLHDTGFVLQRTNRVIGNGYHLFFRYAELDRCSGRSELQHSIPRNGYYPMEFYHFGC